MPSFPHTQAVGGRDVQGINWKQSECTRGQYREERLRQYHNYHDLEVATNLLERVSSLMPKGDRSYDFRLSSRKVRGLFIVRVSLNRNGS